MNRITTFVTNLTRLSSNVIVTTEVSSALRIPLSQFSTCSSIYGKKNNGKNKDLTQMPTSSSVGLALLSPSILQITQNHLANFEQIRYKWNRASFRVQRGSRGNNGLRSPHTIQGAFFVHPHKKTFKKTRSRAFPGHVDVFNREGERDPLLAAEERYKRLDWGWYIGTRPGRFSQMWKKTDDQNWRDEQHITLSRDANRKLDKMFASATKRPRFIPDDPYEKYNTKVNYWKYREGLVKNRELIRKYGNPVYLYDRYKAHMNMDSDQNVKPKLMYAPPGYLETINGNKAGVYRPDGDTTYPTVEMAPHFQRQRLYEAPAKIKSKKIFRRKLGRPLPKYYQRIREMEMFSKEPLPLWSPLNFPTYHPN